MSGSIFPTAVSVYPEPADYISTKIRQHSAQDSPHLSRASSAASGSESEPNVFSAIPPTTRKSRMERPRMGDRQRSSSIIIPKGRDTYQREKPEYPPDDARAMSPRRNSEALERLELGVRKKIQDQAHTLQSSLQALATRIDEVRQDHDKLENENRLLQEYIGGLTRSMSKENLGRSSSTRKGKK
ncbi:hypothetical protein LTR70_009562 [Exophiala xenobiotica]|uniref:BZIP transcription factor n=1 Tax=Lithohypha guttulata TaxID=1690604 RepID=A0ABR0JXV1_9EURO|nr:hypothetical protein LTR24_009444 [Lithohypha guttulata]KAK5310343.1 hypothetical protein LTR70_009562 [Exophiala xenobiotica]